MLHETTGTLNKVMTATLIMLWLKTQVCERHFLSAGIEQLHKKTTTKMASYVNVTKLHMPALSKVMEVGLSNGITVMGHLGKYCYRHCQSLLSSYHKLQRDCDDYTPQDQDCGINQRVHLFRWHWRHSIKEIKPIERKSVESYSAQKTEKSVRLSQKQYDPKSMTPAM